MKKRIGVFFLVLISTIAFSQNFQKQKQNIEENQKNIIWENVQKIEVSENQFESFLYFRDAIFNEDYGKLPVFFERVKLPSISDRTIFGTYDEVFIELTQKEIDAIEPDLIKIKNNLTSNVNLSIEKKIPFSNVYFLPFRKNPTSGKYEKLISFKTKITFEKSNLKLTNTQRVYANNSVLATGNWYNFYVNSTGIFKISYSDLVDLGIDLGSLNTQNIRIYGNGGGMLPEDNITYRPDDLMENPIIVKDLNNNGIFDSDDYILFYGQSPTKWKYNSTDKKFHHRINDYSDVSVYFITADLGVGKRVTDQASITNPANATITTFNDYACHEKDSANLIKSGREWYGEMFDIITAQSFSFSFPNIDASSKVYLTTNLAARNTNSPTLFSINTNGFANTLTVPSFTPNGQGEYARGASKIDSISTSNPNIVVKISKSTSSAIGWLNYIEINTRRNLIFSGSQMAFRDAVSVNPGLIGEFSIGNGSPNLKIWDVTNPFEITNQLFNISGTNITYRNSLDSIKEYIVFNETNLGTIRTIGKVANQNLHALGQFDFIIVSHPNFVSEAYRLAKIHENQDSLSVVIVTPQQIYNEFSSGNQDISAIRDFVKMFYDRAAGDTNLLPKYLLLFGDGSYDNKNRITSNTNYIPTYQSSGSLNFADSYVTDDYYGILDNTETMLLNGTLDIGIGRFTVQNFDEAKNAVDKVERYFSKYDLVNQGGTCSTYSNTISNFGDWRNTICFVADDGDGNMHVAQANQMATFVDTAYNNFNVDKIYLDAYPQVSFSGGQRAPDVNDAITKRVEKGALIVNYTGHGGEVGWAHESILTVEEINSWTNSNNMPAFITATCEFSRFDDPARTSAGEYVFLNPNGGGIALFTTTRLAQSQANFALNSYFYKNVFERVNGKYPKMGDNIRTSKVLSGSGGLIRNFVLIGDPALQLAFPNLNVVTNTVNSHPVYSEIDTLKAFSKVTVSGNIADANGIKQTNFNGVLYPSVFDKKMLFATLGSDDIPFDFLLQKNLLYKGKVSIKNGDFNFSFIVPKDIAYNYGIGRISYYAKNETTDASGFYENPSFIIGGTDTNSLNDVTCPNIKLYLNDSKFVFGGITDENPLLLAYVSDSNGINTVGNGIGHDLTAILDEETNKVYSLNDYYEADLDTYKSGVIRYPFSKLSEGNHNLKLKVWDIYNNSADAYTEFVVASSASLALSHVLNYPNPFTTKTSFFFEHNQPCCDLEVQIQIFTITGKLCKTISTVVLTNGFRAEPIDWDGLDDYGDRIGKGVYLYKLRVRDKEGSYSEKLEKLVILK
ncbi:MAG: type IX secretion system sortase PorU [Bacteroidetes bacterium]|nr:type IX secretion system sortase PorU [Bacteroidota bacterium]